MTQAAVVKSKRSRTLAGAARLSLVIPTFNEAQSISRLLLNLVDTLQPAMPGRFELVVVDDESPDGTQAIVGDLMRSYPQIRLIRKEARSGPAAAVFMGFGSSDFEIAGTINADLQHPPELIVSLVEAIEYGADLAVASRFVPGGGIGEWSLARRLLSFGAHAAGRILVPELFGRVHDPLSGYFLVRRDCVRVECLKGIGYKTLIEVMANSTFRKIVEVPYTFEKRTFGASKVTLSSYVDYVVQLLKLRRSRRRF